MRHCTLCAGTVSDTAEFCKHCGAELRARGGTGPKRGKKRSRKPRDGSEAAVRAARAGGSRQAAPQTLNRNDVSDPTAVPAAAAFKGLPKSEALRLIAKSITKAAAKSLAICAAVLGPGFVLLFIGQIELGMAWLFLGSFGMVAWTYRKPWRLGFVSCLIPPLAAAACYAIQLALFADAAPPALLVLVAVGAGIAVGWLRGRAHEIHPAKGGIFAQRTIAYLGIWAAAYGITQLLSLTAANLWLVRGGLITGAFSTAMLVVVSLVLMIEFRQLRMQAG